MKRIVFVLSLGLLLQAPGLAQEGFEDVEIEANHVAGKVHMLTGRGGNIGASVGDDGILIIDDQFAPLADEIRSALGDIGEGQVRFLLNTHWHFDHTGGNSVFGEDATILAHTNVRKRLVSGGEVLGRTIEPAPEKALPVITFNESLSVHFNGEEIRALHYPGGHTDGDSVVWFTGSNVLHAGDLFFSGTFPFVDLESGGNAVTYAANVGKILERLPEGVKIIPGHGPLSTEEDFRAFHQMLLETIDIVRERKAAGKSLDEAKSEGLPEQWESWGQGFVKTPQWIGIVYRSLN